MTLQTTSAPASSAAAPPEVTDRAKPALPTSARVTALLNRFAPLLAFVGLLILWEGGCRLFKIPSFLLPPPSAIISGAQEIAVPLWLGHAWATIRVALMGYIVAVIVSIPLAIALSSSKLLSRTLYPIIVVVHSMPIVAVAPIIVVTLGASDLPRVVITFLITFFPIVVTTTAGLLATPEELVELSRSLRASRFREITHIRLPFALPYIFSALKIATTLSVVGAVVAEFVAAEKGLGYMIMFSTSFFKINHSFASLAILVVVSLTFFQSMVLLQKWLAPWSLPRSER